jgi:hypothetical protein
MNFQSLKTRIVYSIDAQIASETNRIAALIDRGVTEWGPEPLKYAEIFRANVAAAESFDVLCDAFMLYSAAAGRINGGPRGSVYEDVIVPEDTLNACDGDNSAGAIFAAAFLQWDHGEKFSDWIHSLEPADVD